MDVVNRKQVDGASFRKRAVGEGWKDRNERLSIFNPEKLRPKR